MSRTAVIAALVLVLAAGGAALYHFVLPGLSSARPAPPVIETEVATWLLLHSVPPEAAARANPLKPDEANVAAGASAFQQKCSVCHRPIKKSSTKRSKHLITGTIQILKSPSISFLPNTP